MSSDRKPHSTLFCCFAGKMAPKNHRETFCGQSSMSHESFGHFRRLRGSRRGFYNDSGLVDEEIIILCREFMR
ncbi:hypothetical protein CEXT_288781 [Caerostris extrusa]|uniref:Uncharacterized protein n=1 Tax=Caerostris extrusa TaxID=172846 RepID=A0AAV4VB99_CAEEX|nr:hypothetical protein CEXT_288781 [Caerostris extrusa]